MTDTKTIVRILAAVRVEQGRPVFNVSTVSEQVLRTDEATRDRLALMLQKEGYIDGLYIIDGIDNVAQPFIHWPASHPALTMKGTEYIENNSAARKAIEEIKQAGISAAAQIVANAIMEM